MRAGPRNAAGAGRAYRSFVRIRTSFPGVNAEVDEERLIVVTRAQMRGPGSGVEVNAVSSGLWTIRDGKGRSFKLYQSKADALEAAGLRGVGDRSFGRKRRLALKAALSVSREILRGRCRAGSGLALGRRQWDPPLGLRPAIEEETDGSR